MIKNLGIVVALLLVIAFAPFLIIWAMNTLFALGIAYNFWTWLAVIILSSVVNGSKNVRTKD